MQTIDIRQLFDASMSLTVSYEEAKDEGFVFSLFREARERELLFTPLNDSQKEAFLRMQFALREADYAKRYEAAEKITIVSNGVPVGRLLFRVGDGHVHIIDMAVAGRYQNRGIGSKILNRLCLSAQKTGLPVMLHVAKENRRAAALYERAGFETIEADELQLCMQKDPDSHLFQLRSIGKTLLDHDAHEHELKDGMHALCELFGHYSSIKPFMPDGTDGGDIYLSSGMALGPSDAAACALEYRRSVQFIRGAKQALEGLVEKAQGRGVNIVYAGCGPYATLLFPLLGHFKPEELNITLLDINPVSLESAKNIADAFGFEAYIDEAVVADAALYTYPHDKRLDMVITETMQVSLKKEPHVSVVLNLAEQLQSEGVLIPQAVTVEAVLKYNDSEDACCWPLLTLTKETRFKGNRSQTAAITLPRTVDAGAQLFYRTAIDIYPGYTLTENQCSLTMPRRVKQASALRPGESIEFFYELSGTPDFVVTRGDAWSEKLFDASGFVASQNLYSDKNITASNVDEVVRQLHELGTPAALKIVQTLRQNPTQGGWIHG